VADLRLVLAGGGTAGHVNPLLATAAALAPADILVLGTQEGMEARLVPAAGLHLRHIPRVPLPRRPSADLLRLPLRLRRAIREAREAISDHRAHAVVGFGGYVATPAYFAARRLGIPIVVHEQNAVPGLANRLGARWADAVAVTFTDTPLRGAQLVGLPLRAAISELLESLRRDPQGTRRAAARRLGLAPDRPTLLVTGGSLGAQRINEAMTAAAPDLSRAGIQVLHLTGAGKDGPVRAAAGEGYHVMPYLDDMALAYACADFVVCRAGAGTVSELTALGIPAMYVPLPIGNGEQRRNAAGVVSAGGGVLVEDEHFGHGDIIGTVIPLLRNDEQREAMATRAEVVGIQDGAQRLASLVTAIATKERA